MSNFKDILNAKEDDNTLLMFCEKIQSIWIDILKEQSEDLGFKDIIIFFKQNSKPEDRIYIGITNKNEDYNIGTNIKNLHEFQCLVREGIFKDLEFNKRAEVFDHLMNIEEDGITLNQYVDIFLKEYDDIIYYHDTIKINENEVIADFNRLGGKMQVIKKDEKEFNV